MFLKLMPIFVVLVFMYAGTCCMARGAWNDAVYSFLAAALNYVVFFHPFQ